MKKLTDYLFILEAEIENTNIAGNQQPEFTQSSSTDQQIGSGEQPEEFKLKSPDDEPPQKTEIDYDADNLDYEVEVTFHRELTKEEKQKVQGATRYWTNIPYVSVEGSMGAEWQNNKFFVSIDFTKSASDDIGAREVLEKLSKWIAKGTPKRKDGTRKEQGLGFKAVSVKTGMV